MRLIKFKSVDNSYFLKIEDGVVYTSPDNVSWALGLYYGHKYNTDLFEFTGLYDMAGREVYEGDRLKKQTKNMKGLRNGSSYKTVKWRRTNTQNGWNVCDTHKWEVVTS